MLDERGGVAEEADAVVVAWLPAAGQRVVLDDLLEVVAVVAGAVVIGGGMPPLALVKEAQGGNVIPQGDALSAAVVLALGALPLETAEAEVAFPHVSQPALPAGVVDIVLHLFACDAADGGGHLVWHFNGL